MSAEELARLDRIEGLLHQVLAAQSAPTVALQLPPELQGVTEFTTAQYAKLVNRSTRWVADHCAARLIPTVNKSKPYRIPAWVAVKTMQPAPAQPVPMQKIY